MVKLHQKLSVVNNQRSKPIPRLNLDQLKRADVAERYAVALGETLSDDNTAMPLGDHWRKVEHRQSTLLFQEKKRRFEESDEQLLAKLSQSGDIRSFYRRLKEARSGFAPKTAMCRDADGNLLTDERKVIERSSRSAESVRSLRTSSLSTSRWPTIP
ncbi:uncharacterized protein LOC118509207 [Anopheles stephensi]|uniref:uncharacterized protein LOC118509207 n=1 Tax=Anopheles stephensi TaxID=30069 RepID=UPI001658AEFA|nr:uncharacterized protein LOC118509207 [Anopheles stephensi]